jgi:hypothetical protein
MKPILQKIHWLFFAKLPLAFTLFCFCCTALLIFINYYFNLYNYIQTAYSKSLLQVIAYALIYFLAFVSSFAAYSFFTKENAFWKKKAFVVIILSAPIVFGFQQYFYQHTNWVNYLFTENNRTVYYTTFEWLCRSIILLLYSFLIVWMIGKQPNLVNTSKPTLVPKNMYAYMILTIVPFIILAASTNSFQASYPKIKLVLTHYPSIEKAFYFETAYTLNFIAIEVFFRYILIIVLARYCGVACIVAMAMFYCTIHFGKPLLECISSFLGGILLGLIAYEYQTIKGGILLHLTIAYVMEMAGYYFLFS